MIKKTHFFSNKNWQIPQILMAGGEISIPMFALYFRFSPFFDRVFKKKKKIKKLTLG